MFEHENCKSKSMLHWGLKPRKGPKRLHFVLLRGWKIFGVSSKPDPLPALSWAHTQYKKEIPTGAHEYIFICFSYIWNSGWCSCDFSLMSLEMKWIQFARHAGVSCIQIEGHGEKEREAEEQRYPQGGVTEKGLAVSQVIMSLVPADKVLLLHTAPLSRILIP